MSARILLVDDHDSWRGYVSSELQKHRESEIIESSDGLEAVQKAEELRPDLIILDIGLPGMSGIEAARQILERVPTSRILFLSQHSSPDMVEGALSTGAKGYVVKSDAGSELWPAVDAILSGKSFISTRLAGRVRDAVADEPIVRDSRHEVELYQSDEALVEGMALFVETGLKAGDAVIVIMTEAHQNLLRERLQACGLDLGRAAEQGKFIPLDATAVLSAFMVDGSLDETKFREMSSDLMMRAVNATEGEQRVVACGECAPLLWKEGNSDAAARIEQLWDEIAKQYGMDILCGYSCQDDHSDFRQRICAIHSAMHSA